MIEDIAYFNCGGRILLCLWCDCLFSSFFLFSDYNLALFVCDDEIGFRKKKHLLNFLLVLLGWDWILMWLFLFSLHMQLMICLLLYTFDPFFF